MKVRINSYRDYIINPHRWFDKWICYNHAVESAWLVDEENYTKLDKKIEKITDVLSNIFRPINFWWMDKERKIDVKIDNFDVWNLDSTLAYVILPALKVLRDQKHGSPFVEDIDCPNIKNDADDTKSIEARWNYVLDQIIWSFEQVNSDWEEQYFEKKDGKYSFDREGMKLHEEKMNKGFQLFGKYYSALWS